MSDKVVAFPSKAMAAREAMLDLLEDTIEEVEGGAIACLCISFVRPDGSVGHGHSAADSAAGIIGAVEVSKNKLIQQALAEAGGRDILA